ncbi:biogenesis of lysosome-related organelles complex 1 subunit 5-like [Dendronephthya gigantea]|uniref:biogenesis of lysosome-related organelles complex 1 subunit 5-like n=1 Tax=Dendronephthya gigantea TaxID=151771 RepID=UPI00106DC7E4|nr:biogenesis of lysosome-related organelles complex 1 subunit 5-like [Dendronephthya gigantea]XP_028416761.1 biogenesis of lysosome-related organelles complex 1 subunit 5-like [Dendronephthya gigantea]
MSAEKLVRDIGDVYGKLFNHHGPIQREVNFYVQEFETKRKDRELSRLNQASVNCGHIETLLPEVDDLAKEHVQTVLDRAENAITKANAILENKLPEENAEKVEERRARMDNEWKTLRKKLTFPEIRLNFAILKGWNSLKKISTFTRGYKRKIV